MTVDRDAPAGKEIEVWSAPLYGNSFAILVLNKSDRTKDTTVSWDHIGIPSSFRTRGRLNVLNFHNLWSRSHSHQVYNNLGFTVIVASHGVAMFNITFS